MKIKMIDYYRHGYRKELPMLAKEKMLERIAVLIPHRLGYYVCLKLYRQHKRPNDNWSGISWHEVITRIGLNK